MLVLFVIGTKAFCNRMLTQQHANFHVMFKSLKLLRLKILQLFQVGKTLTYTEAFYIKAWRYLQQLRGARKGVGCSTAEIRANMK